MLSWLLLTCLSEPFTVLQMNYRYAEILTPPPPDGCLVPSWVSGDNYVLFQAAGSIHSNVPYKITVF